MAKDKKLTLKELKTAQQEEYNQDLTDARNEANLNALQKLAIYKNAKRLRWYDYIIVLAISAFFVGLSFIFGSVVMKNNERVEWFVGGFTVLAFLIYWILGWYKNRQTAKFYNSSIMRYQKTFTEFEGTMQRIKWITLLITLALLVSSLIILFTYNI